MVKLGQKRQKWEQEQTTMKTTRSKKMMAARTNIDVTSFHFLLSIARPFEKRFREVFGNARILNFYLSIRAWEEKSLPESYLGCFYIVFGEGKATKENMSIFWFIWPLKGQCPDYAHARASFVFPSWDNRTVILTRQVFLPGRTADGVLLFIFSSNILLIVEFQRSLSSYLKFD